MWLFDRDEVVCFTILIPGLELYQGRKAKYLTENSIIDCWPFIRITGFCNHDSSCIFFLVHLLQLCFRKGDVIVVTQMEDGGWWEGTLRGRTGWFPSNYVRECEAPANVGVDHLQFPGSASSASSPSSAASGSAVLLLPQQQLANRVLILETFVEAEKSFVQEMTQFRGELVPPLLNQEKCVNRQFISEI